MSSPDELVSLEDSENISAGPWTASVTNRRFRHAAVTDAVLKATEDLVLET